MRQREPGFYVRIKTLGADLLDGPWASVEAANKRAGEIQKEADRGATIVRIAADGTSIREVESES